MGRTTRSVRALSALLAVGGLSLTACDSLPFFGHSDKPQPKATSVVAQKPPGAKPAPGGPQDAQDVSAAARQQAERLERAMASGGSAGSGADGQPDALPEVQWIDLKAEARHAAGAQVARGNAPASIAADASVAPEKAGDHREAAARPLPAARVDRHTMIARLLEDIRSSPDPAMNKALAVLGLTLVEPGRSLDASDLGDLSQTQRDEMKRLADLLGTLAHQLAAGGKLPDREALATQVEALSGNQPIRIRGIQLCRRVNGYGVYDAFDTNTFVAGREQPIVIYVELDQFRAAKGSDDLYHVKLAQEVTLYNESDGLAVWRQPGVDIADDSRNRRHDFFLVQLVRLPANLTVGKYRLNVRVTDVADSSLDEMKVPLQIVADESMVSLKNK